MVEHVVNWFVDTLARTETLDLYFVITDLIDFPQTPAQQFEGAFYDAMATQTERQVDVRKSSVPLGKRVF